MGNFSEAGKGGRVEMVGNTRHCMRLVSSEMATWDGARTEILEYAFIHAVALL